MNTEQIVIKEIADEDLLAEAGITIVPVYEVRGHNGLVLMSRDSYGAALGDGAAWLRDLFKRVEAYKKIAKAGGTAHGRRKIYRSDCLETR